MKRVGLLFAFWLVAAPAAGAEGEIVSAGAPEDTTPLAEAKKISVGAAPTTSGRASENVVTEAEDAFGFSVGRESIGLYSSSNVRGFSPLAAGNVRIEGLYFDPYLTLMSRLRRSTTIRVGLSAQGFPFPSPTGIVDYSFRKPGESASLSASLGGDSYGNASLELDAALPLAGKRLSLAAGAQFSRNSFVDGISSWSHNEALALRWRPSDAVEIIPFWQRSEVADDEAAPVYIPAGDFLPPQPERRRYRGPRWSDYDSVAGLQGILANIAPAPDWLVRVGVFRSLYDDRSTFAHLLTDVTAEGTADRLIIADPRSRFVSLSGEVRVTKSFADGDRLHVVHASFRARDRRQLYGGSAFREYGPTRVDADFAAPEPDFDFGEQDFDRVRQWTAGLAYEGRWRGVGELSFGLSRSDYRKSVELPGLAPAATRRRPWLYNATAALYLGPSLTAFAGHARGLEESGIAPVNAINRNQPLPAILTRQVDAGLRYKLADSVTLIAGVFDLRKPYYNLDTSGRFDLLGDVVNRGVETSISGKITSRLSVVAGGVFLRPRVTGDGVALGRVGRRPVGVADSFIDLNVDWQIPWSQGVSLDFGVARTGAIPATRNGLVRLPARTIIDLGGRYRFKLGGRAAVLRLAVSNLTDADGFELRGAGSYALAAGRVVSAYLTADF